MPERGTREGTGHRVDEEMAVGRAAVGEGRDPGPLRPPLGLGHFDDQRFVHGHDGPVLKQEALTGDPFGDADDLVLHHFGMGDVRRAADGESREPGHLR